MTGDRLSVVMPTHNRAADMARAAASVLAQGPELELVIVDDHSTDATADELDRLADGDRRVKVLRPGGDQALGPCAARNVGLAAATGELVSFCDDDDEWAPGAAATMLGFLDAHPRVVMASSWHRVAHRSSGRAAVFRGPTRYDARHLLWLNVVALPFGVIRRAALSFDVRFDPALPTGEDWDLWLRCAQDGPVRTVPEVCYVYTQHDAGRVTRAPRAQVDGRRGFLAKHGHAMTASCRLYHDTILAGYEGGRPAMRATLAGAARRAPLRAAIAGSLLAAGAAASRAGQRRGDPGLPVRLTASAVGRLGGRRPPAV